jgi:Cu+-exporting ATPase
MRNIVFILGVFFLISCGSQKKQNEGNDSSTQAALTEVTLNVGGMHCDMCVASIEKGVGALDGVGFVKAELNDSTAVVKFNETETSLAEITQAIERRGYTVKE